MAQLGFDEIQQLVTEVQRLTTQLPQSIQSIHPQTSHDLYNFLYYAPFIFDLKLPLTLDMRKMIIAVLWYNLSMGRRSVFDQLVGNSLKIIIPMDDETTAFSSDAQRQQSVLVDDSDYLPLEYREGQQGKACGHVFDRGEGIYRCRQVTCALDDTCVFCFRCFDAAAHEGHDTTMSIALGSGGCCDCGDPEAWKLAVYCKYHSPQSSDAHVASMDTQSILDGKPDIEKIPLAVTDAIRQTITTVLEFAISSLARSCENPQFVNDPAIIKAKHAPDVVMGEDKLMNFSCVLWNDESHSFQEVIDQVAEATNCTEAYARSVAVAVDKRGRYPVRTSDSIPLLIGVASIISRISLTVSIRPTRDVFREEIAGVLVNWLKTLSRFIQGSQVIDGVHYESIAELVRSIICEELCNPLLTDLGTYNSTSPFIDELQSPTPVMLRPHRPRVHYFLVLDSYFWKEMRNSLRELYIGTLIVNGDIFKKSMAVHFVNSYLEVSRCYLFHDREIDLSIMNFTVQIFTVPTIANYLMHHTLILPYMLSLLKAHFLSDVLPDEYSLKTKYYETIQKATVEFKPIYPVLRFDGEAVRNKRHAHLLFDVRYLLSSRNVCNSASANNTLATATTNGRVSILLRFLDLCMVWQGMNPQMRSLHNHIEYETDDWLHAFNHSINILPLMRGFANCFFSSVSENSAANLLNAMSETRDALLKWTLHRHVESTKNWQTMQISIAGAMRRRETVRDGFHIVTLVPGRPCRIPDYHVAFQPISFHKCLHWLLANLLRNTAALLRHTDSVDKRASIVKHIFDIVADSPTIAIEPASIDSTHILDMDEMLRCLSVEDRMSLIFDFPLRSIVLVSQIKAGVWVRNGYNVREQAKHYADAVLREAHDHDMLLLQYATVCLGPDKLLTMLVDRYGLVSWFQGRTISSDTAHYESAQISSFVQDMLQVIMILLTERSNVAAISAADELRREIIHYLAVHRSGTAYSELSRRIADSLVDAAADCMPDVDDMNEPTVNSTSVDAILQSVANFKFPDGTADHGLYELKDEMYANVDPWFWHYTRNEREDLGEVLRKRLEKKRALNRHHSNDAALEEEAVRRPKLCQLVQGTGFDRLNNLVHSPIFNQIIFYSLWNVTRTVAESGQEPVNSEMILAEAVHLLMVGFEIVGASKTNVAHTNVSDIGFIQHAVLERVSIPVRKGAEMRPTTLLELILSLVDRANEEDIKEQAPRLRFLVRRFEEMGGLTAETTIVGWRDKSNWDLGKPRLSSDIQSTNSSNNDTESSEQEKRKLAVKARQANIMAQFAQAQKSFIANFGDDLDDLDDDEVDDPITGDGSHAEDSAASHSDHRTWKFAAGTCIVCQEDASSGDKMYGMLCLLRHTTVCRQISFGDVSSLAKIITALPESFDTVPEKNEMSSVDDIPASGSQTPVTLGHSVDAMGSDPNLKKFANLNSSGVSSSSPIASTNSVPLKQISVEGITATSCGHLMHYSCFDTYTHSIDTRHLSQPTRNHPEDTDAREFMCPLCKSLGNTVLPVVWSNRHESVNWRGSNVSWKHTEKYDDRQLLGEMRLWLTSSELVHVSGASKMDTSTGAQSDREACADLSSDGMVDILSNDMDADSNSSTGWTADESNDQNTAVHHSSISELFNKLFVDHLSLSTSTLTFKGGSDSTQSHELLGKMQSVYSRNMYAELKDLVEEMRDDGKPNPFETNLEPAMLICTRMWDLFAYTISSLEILGRGSSSSWTPGLLSSHANQLVHIGVLDTISSQMHMCLRLLSEATLGTAVYAKCPQATLMMYGNRFLASLFGDHSVGDVKENHVSERDSQAHPPALLRDGFSHLVALSMSIIPARVTQRTKNETEVFQWMRVMWVFELVRCVVSVVESILLHGDTWITDPQVVFALNEHTQDASTYFDTTPMTKDKNQSDYIVTEPANLQSELADTPVEDDSKYAGLAHLINVVLNGMKLMPDAKVYVEKTIRPDMVCALFKRVGLVYARRCAVLLYARFGLVPPGGAVGFGFDLAQSENSEDLGPDVTDRVNAANDENELMRLCLYLDLPKVDTLVSLPIVHDRVFGQMVLHWVHDFGRTMANHFGVVWSTEAARRREKERQKTVGATRSAMISISSDAMAPPLPPQVSLELPLVFELAKLPQRLAKLFEESRRKVCRRCGTVPLDPALCVLCGMILCSQSYCCSDEDHGECNQHIRECGGSVGIFLLIKQAMMILLLPNGKGTFMDLPYLDAHGEVDPQLRRGRPLFLNRKRYGEIRKLWLTHAIPSYVARKIDQAFDAGGWTTF
ncbi:hypothetical protein BATDEDRAFT_21290 [Batrachochytrium dendrobatidis JAM81]|uniref:E3 ubiquitin-protein ligase n=1 Tax=Batrachochytrium dendrobatidis (strain JAM81 / FGSC 10211) TaxID=684364 RepID=F4NS80_BATDJ|nr:uncharacterized protein BATDEDRAFT_21290 [Batrachochytrium dendrobatidis JAM81]EGF83804.1 hypothetical protein BATDEDRAFT_21290 [Batrachochytrium dendrobatidis JAM81]|eukprot:XP_006675246.1 hypothetical protein BATDEDRAFT_21290 [Batrachochytrium dendrobatidis JAM81]